ncbi:MAG: hypothetical protein ACWA5P_04340 [bacterium]
MKKDKEFFVPYIEGSLGPNTKRSMKRFVIGALIFLIVSVIIFSFFQKPFDNSTFELTQTSRIEGVFHENPYPMLRVQLDQNNFKNVVLLGFGKSSASPYLESLLHEQGDLIGKTLAIEGNLIYHNGKTLLQITDEEKVVLVSNVKQNIPSHSTIGKMTLKGEIIDPKCYFGVMKPGKGKIHRSCAVRCISGGIPPVLATTDNNNISEYYLITDINGKPINEAILPYVGKPAEINGIVTKQEDWYILKIDPKNIKELQIASSIY